MLSLALVVSQYYEDLAAEMTALARENAGSADTSRAFARDPGVTHEQAAEQDVEVVETVPVPGVYDAPLAADRLARREDVDAVVVLGAVVTGDTDHDQVVAHAAARRVSDVALRRDTPVTFGVVGPATSYEEAEARVEKAARAVDGALDLLAALP